ncbi:hypothetical protein ACH4OW_23520 [Streptomyces sp. NPDC017056]|uniref:hypothetical protein n=1 Tax=Streptomyces sp. NPDC017056 TaxID=3364973 RepID=UPI00379C359A
MNASQQHMLDAYRAAQHGEPAPAHPGTGDVRALREVRLWLRFQAVVTPPEDRPLARARRAARRALAWRPVRLTRSAHPAPSRPLPHPPLASSAASTPTMTDLARLGDPCG